MSRKIMPWKCSVEGCEEETHSRNWCRVHYESWRSTGDPEKAKRIRKRGTGSINAQGYKLVTVGKKTLRMEHVVIAESALGRKLKNGEEVHHFNGNKLDNSPANLVICPNRSYHRLLHQRQDAMAACGNPSWRKCWICKTYDAPENLRYRARHKKCSSEYDARRWRK